MASRLGYIGELILTEAPIPAPVLPALVEQFADQVAQNDHLTDAQRIAWLAAKPSAKVAAHLCSHRFSPEGLGQVLDIERRRNPVKALVDHNRRAQDLTTILSMPHGSYAAKAAIRVHDIPRPLILEHFDALGVEDQVRLLLHCDHSVTDAEIAARIASMDLTAPRSAAGRNRLVELFDSLVCYRPGLTAELRAVGHPTPARLAVAASPWIGEHDPVLLFDTGGHGTVDAALQQRLARNPWVDPSEVRCMLTDPVAISDAETRQSYGRVLREAPMHLTDPKDLRVASLYSVMELTPAPSRLTQLQLLLAWNPNLNGYYADELTRRIKHIRVWLGDVPSWVLQPTLERFAANYPNQPITVPAVDAEGSDRYGKPAGPDHPNFTRTLFEVEAAAGLHVHRKEARRAALTWFAEQLGESSEAWTAAVLVADSVGGTLAEIAEIAAVTAAAPVGAAA